jgi:hypothetical protein
MSGKIGKERMCGKDQDFRFDDFFKIMEVLFPVRKELLSNSLY